jgi:hypothetical protein
MKTSILTLTKAFFILLVMCCLFSCGPVEDDGKYYPKTIEVLTINGDTATFYRFGSYCNFYIRAKPNK